MAIYSSHFFETSPAGSGNTNTKAIAGLGIELPADVLASLARPLPQAGLGIYIPSSAFEEADELAGLTPSPSPSFACPSAPPAPLPACVARLGELAAAPGSSGDEYEWDVVGLGFSGVGLDLEEAVLVVSGARA